MGKKVIKLFEPGRIGQLDLKNLIALAPHGTLMCELDGRTSRREFDYLAALAAGGTGLIIPEGAKISRALEKPAPFAPFAIDSDALVPSLADMFEAVHFYGAKIMMQLFVAFGRQAGEIDPKKPPVASSAIPTYRAIRLLSPVECGRDTCFRRGIRAGSQTGDDGRLRCHRGPRAHRVYCRSVHAPLVEQAL